MGPIVEKDGNGRITIPPEATSAAKPHTRYSVETEGSTIRLVPVEDVAAEVERLQEKARRLWTEGTPEERAKAIREWMDEPRPPVPHLPDEALRRENMYD